MFKRLFTSKKLKWLALVGGVGLYVNRDRVLLKLGEKYLSGYSPQLRSGEGKTVGEVISDYFSKVATLPPLTDDSKQEEMVQEDSPEIKEYQRLSTLKVQGYYDKAYAYDEKLKELQKTKEDINERLAKEHLDEEKKVKEIIRLKEDSLTKAKELSDKSLQLNTERLEMMNVLLKKQSDYMRVHDKLSHQLNTCFKEELESLNSTTVEPLKKEDEDNRELLIRKIKELTEAQQHNWNNQMDYIAKEVNESTSLLNSYSNSISQLADQSANIAKTYLAFKHDEYDLLNRAFSLDLVLEINERNKCELLASMLSEYKKENKEKIISEVYPNLMANINSESDQLLKIVSEGTKDERLNIQHNFNFLLNSFRGNYLDIVISLKYLLNSPQSSPLYQQNLLKLQRMAKLHGDDFVTDLIANTNGSKSRQSTRKDIKEEYLRIRNELAANLLLEKHFNIFTVMISPLIGFLSRGIMRMYHPLFNPIKDRDKEIVKRYKALSFIGYFINRGNYAKALENAKLLNKAYQSVSGLSSLLQGRVVNENAVELLERHII